MDTNFSPVEWLTTGLTTEEAAASAMLYGENRLGGRKRKGFLQSFLESFGDPMIKILLIALAVNVIFLFRDNNWFETLGIAAAILLATFVSTLSEYGSESAFERLQEEAARVNCRVKRDGRLVEIPVEKAVVGDICLLQSGDRVPADGVILTGGLDVDQSSLNGESREAVKAPGKSVTGGFDDRTLLFGGSVVCGGEGLMRITSVGENTVYGRIGKEIQREKRDSPLKKRLGQLARRVGLLGYTAAAVTALAYFFNVIAIDNHFDKTLMLNVLADTRAMFGHFLKAATLAVTVVVMAVPEGLPMMITVVLSANMRRMFRDNVLVRKLVGVETAGSMNILFTDKTGTLTRGHLEVTGFVSGAGKSYKKKDGIPLNLRRILFNSIYYNCSAKIDKNYAIGGNATDRAVMEYAHSLFDKEPDRIRIGKVVPFNSAAKLMSSDVTGALNATLVKGAPEMILPRCAGYFDENGYFVPALDKLKLENIIDELNAGAARVVAVAMSGADMNGEGERTQGSPLRLVGFLGIRDEIRAEAVDGVRRVREAGIQTVMITGDARSTAVAIARETGILEEGALCLTSAELAALSDGELIKALPELRVVARALPSDKSRLVRAAQDMGMVAGMTGDGVNDAPALKQADIGFAMGSGAEVAKEAGDIVILDDNIASIAKAISYGRTIFKSIRKFLVYQLSICMCAVGVTVVGPLVGVDMPITVIQMLWINMVMDTLAGLAFSGEKARLKYMREKPKPRNEAIINKYMFSQIAVISVYTTALCLFFLKSPFTAGLFGASGIYRMTAFFALFMFCAIFTSFCARTHTLNLFDYLAANKPFLWIMGIVTAVQICIIYFGGPVFRTSGMEAGHLMLVALMAFTIIPVDLLRKLILSRITGTAGYSGT
ncbi:MAG: calcium-translocating P-type ATPase, PMCA-type [Defluviitaleaceae bacterium]|nr:calcium-translocating P-type ATPase, PMCA-type [Defluviitaleaceae bacterium]MCL2836491.1 calcium-translocating P-type ATPase, PMCA-type [Defluviitaleaceae bacterium]